MKIFSWTAAAMLTSAVVVVYWGGCAFISNARDNAFDLVQVGDTESSVIGLFGVAPSARERPETLFTRYATQPCRSPCVERLWFENRLSFDTEAWSVEMDQSGRVLKKTRWASP